VVSFTLRPPYPQGKSPWYPLDRRLVRPQSRSGRGGEEKNSHSVPGLEPPIIQPVAQHYTAELSWLLPVHTFLRSTLTLHFHLRLRGFFPSGFPTKIVYTLLISFILAACPANLILLHYIALKYLVKRTSCKRLPYTINRRKPVSFCTRCFTLTVYHFHGM
jgi:hypothetical protein